MAVNLTKGQRVSLDKSVTMARIGLGWDINKYDGGQDFDLDACVFLLGANGKVLCDEDFVFYNNLSARNGAVQHTGDNRTGEGDGDDEAIIIDFTKIPQEIQKIAVTVTIFDAQAKNQNFGQVSNSYVRVVKIANPDDQNGEEVLRFDLVEEFSIETALVVCEIYRYNGDWKFNAVAAGYQGGLEALCRSYGVNV
ncbi:MAG TPA: chemical-damaging agent resistance protein C [Ruminococcaceae bacterium]|nr:chemical-damaging agent resistance protein C [Oscillospiraceae bacterium]